MTINTSGEWWVGSDPDDIRNYLAAYTEAEGTHPTTSFRALRCPCGSDRFDLQRIVDITRRTCAECRQSAYICRDPEDWEAAEDQGEPIEPYDCVACHSSGANVAIGFSHFGNLESDSVKWLYVGVRCVNCGILGCFNDCKVARVPPSEVQKRI